MISNSTTSTARMAARPERRTSRRCKITQVLRVRPSNPETDHFDDVRGTLSVSRSGVYFHSLLHSYEVGMRLFITLPYSEDPTSINREYLAEVTRIEPLVTGMNGVGIKFLMELGLQQTSMFSSTMQYK